MVSRRYETMVVLKATGTEAELSQAVAQVEDAIKKLGGSTHTSSNFGRRRLAYRIARQTEGHYQVIEFSLPSDQLSELKRLFQLNETIVRSLILSRDGQRRAVAPVEAGR